MPSFAHEGCGSDWGLHACTASVFPVEHLPSLTANIFSDVSEYNVMSAFRHCDKCPPNQETIVLIHGFRGLSPGSRGSIESVVRQGITAETAWQSKAVELMARGRIDSGVKTGLSET